MKSNPRVRERINEKRLKGRNTSHAFLALVYLLVIGCSGILPVLGLHGSQSIQSYGEISYSRPYIRKMVIWSDGSRETVEVAEEGRILINGSNVVAFGFHISRYGDWGDWDGATANKALDRLMLDGVRFMELSVPYWFEDNRNLIKSLLDFWMPKLYDHKMFVLLCLGQDYPVDVERQMRIANITIEEMCKNVNWANMALAFGYNWEMDYFFPPYGTAAELNAYLANLYPRIKYALQESLIGNVPLIGKVSGPWGEDYSKAVLRWSDIPSIDTYYRIKDSDLDYDWITSETRALHQIISDVGKSGISIWYTEFGLWYKNNPLFTKEKLEYGLSEAGYNDLSLLMIWELWDRNQDGWNAFDGNGNPTDWYIRIAPYFPTSK